MVAFVTRKFAQFCQWAVSPRGVSVWVAVLSLCVAFLSLRTSWDAARLGNDTAQLSESFAQAEMFMHLRDRYHEVDGNLRSIRSYYNANQTNEDVRAVLDEYWRHSYDEWFLTKCFQNGKFSKLWDEHYKVALRSAAKRAVFADALCRSRSSFSGRADEFKLAMAELAGYASVDAYADWATKEVNEVQDLVEHK